VNTAAAAAAVVISVELILRGNGLQVLYRTNERTNAQIPDAPQRTQRSGHLADRLTEILEFHQAWCIPSIFL